MIKKMEEFFLKIAKVAILFAMTLGLLGALGLAIAAFFQYSKTPVEPLPARKAPEKEISIEKELSMDELLKSLEPKKDEEKPRVSKPDEKVSKEVPTLLYMEEITKLYRCTVGFAKAVKAELEDSSGDSSKIETLRARMEQVANQADRGQPYVTSAVTFACAALVHPEVIKMRTDGRVTSVVYPTLTFHLVKWDAIQTKIRELKAEKQEFENNEIRRIASERSAEQARIVEAKAVSLTYISAAGAAFIAFMLLALYLLGAKIESDLRDLNASIQANPTQIRV